MAIATEIKLKTEIIEMIKKNQRLKNRMMFELDFSPNKLYRMITSNSDELTKAATLTIISEELNIPKDELLTA